MTKPGWPHEFDADNWHLCDSLYLYADFFNDADACPDPPSERKLRLMMVAALRAVWDHLRDPRSRAAVEVAERHADDPDPAALEAAGSAAERAYHDVTEPWDATDPDKVLAGRTAHPAWCVTEPESLHDDSGGLPFWADTVCGLETADIPGRTREEAGAFHLRLFHDIFPNPFRPVSLDPAWLTPTVVQLARGIYVDRAFDRLPILADALQDAGCENADVLDHCGGSGPHARGCWAVDLVLGKS
jgi:hypothetical protein